MYQYDKYFNQSSQHANRNNSLAIDTTPDNTTATAYRSYSSVY